MWIRPCVVSGYECPETLLFAGPSWRLHRNGAFQRVGGGVWDRPIAVQEATLPTTHQSATTTGRVPHLNLSLVLIVAAVCIVFCSNLCTLASDWAACRLVKPPFRLCCVINPGHETYHPLEKQGTECSPKYTYIQQQQQQQQQPSSVSLKLENLWFIFVPRSDI